MNRTLYTLLFYLIQPLIWLRLLHRGIKAPAYFKRWPERYGYCQRPAGPKGILVHSVSVGETLAAVPLIKTLKKRYPDRAITVTTMTPTGSERVRASFGDSVHHVYLPYDLPGAMTRFLDRIDPALVVVMETELWPNLIHQLQRRKVPLVIANARLSARSAAGYGRLKRLTAEMLSKVSLVAAQHQTDGNRFIRLGLPRKRLAVTGSIKFDIRITPTLAARAAKLRRQWAAERPVWIAASTHQGEDEQILAAHRQLLSRFPSLLLLLVPRHPERFARVFQLCRNEGFNSIRRSDGGAPDGDTQVVVGDTMGELMLLFGVADLALVGGSLVEHGGHNPLEPAAHGLPVLCGPHMFNFAQIHKLLAQAGALTTVDGADSLAAAVATLLEDEASRQRQGQQALAVVEQNQGALARLVGQLQQLLPTPAPQPQPQRELQ